MYEHTTCNHFVHAQLHSDLVLTVLVRSSYTESRNYNCIKFTIHVENSYGALVDSLNAYL